MSEQQQFPETADKHKRARRALRKARWAIRFMPKERAAMRRVLRAQAEKNGSPWWGEGEWITHLAFDPFTMASLCLRPLRGTSSAPPRTPLGYTCRRCTRLWNRAVAELSTPPERQARP